MTGQGKAQADGIESASKAIAIVSGKGGSGKTMVAVALAQGAAAADRRVMLIDADFGTGGLTYYLSFRVFNRLRTGVTDLFDNPSLAASIDSWAASPDPAGEGHGLAGVRLIPIGKQALIRDDIDDRIVGALDAAIMNAKSIADVVIVDCRGGVDYQSLAVCAIVDEVLLVVETDATSIRSSQHLVEELDRHMVKHKVAGFVLNKAIDDPTTLAMTANSLMQVDYLGAIPFDIEATRSYIQGRVPSFSSLFSRHVLAVWPKLIPELDSYYGKINLLRASDFSDVTLGRPELRVGGVVLAVTVLYASVAALFALYFSNPGIKQVPRDYVVAGILASNVAVVSMLNDALKQSLGRVFRRYSRLTRAIVSFGREDIGR